MFIVKNSTTEYLERVRKINALIEEGKKEEALKLVLAGVKK
jgi:hypothetical protein